MLDLHPEAVANPQAADTAVQSVGNPEWPSAIIELVERRLWLILDALNIPRCGLHAFATSGTGK